MEIVLANYDNYKDYHQTYITALRDGFIEFTPNEWINRFDKEFYEYFRDCYKNIEIEMYICYLDNQPIGVFNIDKYKDEMGNIYGLVDSIYFKKSFHGKGYAKLALNFIEQRLKELGYKKAVLWCSTENARAWRFYVK